MKASDITVTDQFCGAGGSSLGAQVAGARLILGLNHWDQAIRTHNANFPEADHDCVDISATDPRRYRPSNFLITSPECTNHSIAQGRRRKHQRQLELFGKVEITPEEDRSRATMWDVVRFTEYHKYEIVIVENVVDIRFWISWEPWLMAMHNLGYNHKEVYFNSMFSHMKPDPLLRFENGDYAAQSRDRIYVVFWKKGNKAPDLDIRPTGYCFKCEKDRELVQAWKNHQKPYGRYGVKRQYVYVCPVCTAITEPYHYACANIIDWSLPMPLVGERTRPLKPRTIERIQAGLDRYGNDPVLMMLSHTAKTLHKAMTDPSFTMTTQQETALVVPFIVPLRATTTGMAAAHGLEDPLTTIVATATQHYLAGAPFLMHNTQNTNPSSLMDPAHTVVATAQNQYLVAPPFIVNMLQNRTGYSPDTGELPTVTTENHFYLVKPPFVISYYGTDNHSSSLEALPTITGKARHALVDQKVTPDECGFRMLEPHEIQAAQAFPQSYKFETKKKRTIIKLVGNAVTPLSMKILAERSIASLEG